MSTLKVIALISGGKDSFFSILHCIANGHQVVALANLYPAPQQDGATSEDTDSYMYQTIGHAVIPLYEQALGLPLYRHEILGSAVDTNKGYGPTASSTGECADETESLVPLLQKVKAAHPDANAMSTGAILSDYQRTRVESVALRLALTPLSYLWQFPSLPPATSTALLEDMAAVGQDSRIIKVASGGLDDGFLWQNVADRRTITRLTKASMLFGTNGDGSALGEGGEYETLAVAGPSPLWKARIVVGDEDKKVALGEAGSASMQISNARIEAQEDENHRPVRIPDLLDERFGRLLDSKLSPAASGESVQQDVSADDTAMITLQDHQLHMSLTSDGSTVAEQTERIMLRLQTRLSDAGHRFHDVAYTSIILRDMADFVIVNRIYTKSFNFANPPARVTLACSDVLPTAAFLSISATSIKTADPKARQGLHVQSRSYWAPANIGPYSQAITIPDSQRGGQDEPGVVYVAGQIPLVPASMELYKPHAGGDGSSFAHQAVLALQHLFRIGSAVKSRQWLHIIAFITAPSRDVAKEQADVARRVWQGAHGPAHDAKETEEDDENFDVWHQQHGQGRRTWQSTTETTNEPISNALRVPPITVVEVDDLPRGASIEWVAYGSTEANASQYRIPHLEHLLQTFKHRMR